MGILLWENILSYVKIKFISQDNSICLKNIASKLLEVKIYKTFAYENFSKSNITNLNTFIFCLLLNIVL